MRSEFLKFCCWRMSFNAVVLKQNYQSIKCGIKEKVILANTILYIILEQQKHSYSLKKRFQHLLKICLLKICHSKWVYYIIESLQKPDFVLMVYKNTEDGALFSLYLGQGWEFSYLFRLKSCNMTHVCDIVLLVTELRSWRVSNGDIFWMLVPDTNVKR